MEKFKKPPGIKGWNFSKEEVREAREKGKLMMMYADMSSKCDLHCIYCQTKSGKALPGELNLEERMDLIDQGKALGCKTIHIAGQGEPTIDPLFWRHVEYIHRQGIIPVIFTHGMHLDKDAASQLYELNASVIVKVHSFNEKNQDWMAGKKGYTKNRDKTIQNLFDAGFNKENPTRVGIDVVITQQNIAEIPSIFRWARRNNVFPEIKTLLSAHRGASKFVKEKMQVKPEEVKKLHHNILEIDQREFGYTWVPKPPYVGWYCDLYYYHIYVNIFGDVMPCVGFVLQKPLGNIREKSLEELWNHPLMIKVRNIDRHLKGVCANCKNDCYGCPCRRVLRTEDIKRIFESRGCWEDNM
jgi:radical SAM protein with 4Fe4S-binding SPASM domain